MVREEKEIMNHRMTAFLTVGIFGVSGLSGVASADLVSYTFAFEGAVGSLDSENFSDTIASFTLVADVSDIQPGSPGGFNVTPAYGFVTIDANNYDMTDALVADSAVWTYSSAEQGLVIGFGIYVPFEDFTSGSYEGPLDWNLATSFSGNALSGQSVLRGIIDDGIATIAGAFRITAYDTSSLEATLVPAPVMGCFLLAAGLTGVGRRSRRREETVARP